MIDLKRQPSPLSFSLKILGPAMDSQRINQSMTNVFFPSYSILFKIMTSITSSINMFFFTTSTNAIFGIP